MAIKNYIALYIDGVNRTSNMVMPFKWGNFLDERLDECSLSLRAIKKRIFAPLTPVEIEITTQQYSGKGKNKRILNTRKETKYYIVANDNATEFQIGSGLYNHELSLIEVTKYAECIVVDTNTVTNDSGRDYMNSILAEPILE